MRTTNYRLTIILIVITGINNTSIAAPGDTSTGRKSEIPLEITTVGDQIVPITPPDTTVLDARKISIDISSGTPNTTVTIKLVDGRRFSDRSEIIFNAIGDHFGSQFPVPIVFVDSSTLRFTPANVGCGSYQLHVSSRTSRSFSISNQLSYTIIEPCIGIPTITGLSQDTSGPGVMITVNGSNFRPQSLIQLYREQPKTSTITTTESTLVNSSEMTFTTPSDNSACGPLFKSIVIVKNEGINPSSNAVPFNLSCSPNTIDVISYNIQMFPKIKVGMLLGSVCIKYCDELEKKIRAREIAAHSSIRERDVVIFQEAFNNSRRTQIVDALRPLYPYQTKVVGSYSFRQKHDNGGVIIISKWPISTASLDNRERLFGTTCNGTLGDGNDCLADKGVLYACIEKEGRPYHIFGTHLDAGNGDDDKNARRAQLRAIKDFINEKNISNTEPVIIAGDMNIDSIIPNSDLTYMLNNLQATHPAKQGHCVTSGGEYLDYVLNSNVHAQPTTSYNYVHLAFGHRGRILSDHYPVEGHFEFSATRADGRCSSAVGNAVVRECSDGATEEQICTVHGRPGRQTKTCEGGRWRIAKCVPDDF